MLQDIGSTAQSLLLLQNEAQNIYYWLKVKVADSNFFSENSVLENFLILKQCIIQLHNFR